MAIQIGEADHSCLAVEAYYHKDLNSEVIDRGGKERLFPMGKGRKLSFRLEPVGSSELYEVTVKAPEGTVFAPYRKLKSKSVPKSYTYPHIFDKDCNKAEENTQMAAWGFLSPEHAYVETYQRWPESDLAKPWRRIPVEPTSKSHDYNLEVLICPKLGQRAYGYLLLVALTLVSFFAYLVVGVSPRNFSAQSLMMFIPLTAMIFAGYDAELYMRKKLLWFPKQLVNICICIGLLGFVFFCMASGSIIPCAVVQIVSGVGLVICSFCFILCGCWILIHHRRSSWTKRPGAFDKKELSVFDNRAA